MFGIFWHQRWVFHVTFWGGPDRDLQNPWLSGLVCLQKTRQLELGSLGPGETLWLQHGCHFSGAPRGHHPKSGSGVPMRHVSCFLRRGALFGHVFLMDPPTCSTDFSGWLPVNTANKGVRTKEDTHCFPGPRVSPCTGVMLFFFIPGGYESQKLEWFPVSLLPRLGRVGLFEHAHLLKG